MKTINTANSHQSLPQANKREGKKDGIQIKEKAKSVIQTKGRYEYNRCPRNAQEKQPSAFLSPNSIFDTTAAQHQPRKHPRWLDESLQKHRHENMHGHAHIHTY